MQENEPTLENTKVVENADQKAVCSVAHVCLAIMQKYKNIQGYEQILNMIPEGMEEHITKLLWKKGYLTGLNRKALRLSSLGEEALAIAMKEGNPNE